MIIRQCLICGKEFKAFQYRIKIGGGKYCSRECHNISQIGHSFIKGIPKSEEHKRKLSIALKGRIPWCKGKKLSDEHRKNMSAAFMGRVSSFKGKHHTEEAKEKLRQSHLGKKASGETRKKLSIKLKGLKRSQTTRILMAINQFGDKGNNWRGGKTITSGGYVLIHNRAHPFAVNNYIFEHRIVMEKHLKRYLHPTEIVHHINGIVDDNRIENLVLCRSKAEHRRLHKRVN